jgi:hypothetical protein
MVAPKAPYQSAGGSAAGVDGLSRRARKRGSYLHGHSALPARVLVIEVARAATGERRRSRRRCCPSTRATARSASHGPSRPYAQARGSRRSGGRSALNVHAAASTDRHVSHDADWLASTRGPACGARACCRVCRRRVPCAEVHLKASGRNPEYRSTRLPEALAIGMAPDPKSPNPGQTATFSGRSGSWMGDILAVIRFVNRYTGVTGLPRTLGRLRNSRRVDRLSPVICSAPE